MIDNKLGLNDMTGMPGPDMAAPGTTPVENNPATGITVPASPGINVAGKPLTSITPGSATIPGTIASSAIPAAMQADNYLENQKIKSVDSTYMDPTNDLNNSLNNVT